ncbi:hypothetical protein XELAEV_18012936mg [Xenopus laevis]|uniref:Uncharacterized protein n=1 Tax=Xenopus laevis TaxID=8355 RepID=A0A974HZ54_XENLA|nr:hypothetical protein XELAEV_18012936mg [Xenopus laevis]
MFLGPKIEFALLDSLVFKVFNFGSFLLSTTHCKWGQFCKQHGKSHVQVGYHCQLNSIKYIREIVLL